jgi:hypothetical protein
MRFDRWHYPRPGLAKAYLDYFELGLTSARGLFARRRMGKTEFLKQDFIPAAEGAGYLTAYVNFWEHREDPGVALTEALGAALEARGVGRILKKLQVPITKLKASGRVPGLAHATLEAELADDQKLFSASALKSVLTRFDRGKCKLIVIIDEAQILANDEHSDFAHALRAGLDVRKNRLKVIFAGSSETTLRQMFARASEPFYNWAPLEPFELLGREFVTAMAEQVNSISRLPLSVTDALQAFEGLNRTPEFFRRYVERYLVYPFEGSAAALKFTQEHVFNDGNFRKQWDGLLPADREILLMLSEGIADLHSKVARERLGRVLGLAGATDLSTPQHALRRLRACNAIVRLAHGEYRYEDEAFSEWVRRQAIRAVAPTRRGGSPRPSGDARGGKRVRRR